MGGDGSASHSLLHRLGQLAHQTQATRHPARAPREALRQILGTHPAGVQRPQQPCLFDRGLRFVRALGMKKKQGFRLAQVPKRRPHRVLPELKQRAHPFESIDDQIPPGHGAGHHHDRDLLASLRQRGQQSALLLGTAYAQSLVAQVNLMKLQIQASLRGRQGRDWTHPHLALTRPRRLLLAISSYQLLFLPDLVFRRLQD